MSNRFRDLFVEYLLAAVVAAAFGLLLVGVELIIAGVLDLIITP